MLEFLRKWWWPAFVFLYPLVFYPNWTDNFTLTYGVFVRNYLLHFFLAGGLLLEFALHPKSKLSDITYFPKWVWNNKIILLIILLGIFILISSMLSKFPGVAFFGLFVNTYGASLTIFEFLLCMILVFLRRQEDKGANDRILNSLLITGVIISIMAMIEVAIGQALVKKVFRLADIPSAAFGSTGFLAGYCAVIATLFAFKYGETKKNIYLLGFALNVIAVGLTGNRAGLLGLAVALILLFIQKNTRLQSIVLGASATLLVVGSWFVVAQKQVGAQDPGRAATTQTRNEYIQVSLAGWLDTPWFGSGSNQIYWWKYMKKDRIESFFKTEILTRYEGLGKLLYIPDTNAPPENSDFVFEWRNQGQDRQLSSPVYFWTSHNSHIDFLASWGIFSFIILFIMMLWSVTQFKKSAFSLAASTLYIYLWFWYLGYELNALFWIILICAIPLSKEQKVKENVEKRSMILDSN